MGNPKDKVDPLEKTEINEIDCKCCDQTYIGQTRRSVITRFTEQVAHLKTNRFEKLCEPIFVKKPIE